MLKVQLPPPIVALGLKSLGCWTRYVYIYIYVYVYMSHSLNSLKGVIRGIAIVDYYRAY